MLCSYKLHSHWQIRQDTYCAADWIAIQGKNIFFNFYEYIPRLEVEGVGGSEVKILLQMVECEVRLQAFFVICYLQRILDLFYWGRGYFLEEGCVCASKRWIVENYYILCRFICQSGKIIKTTFVFDLP